MTDPADKFFTGLLAQFAYRIAADSGTAQNLQHQLRRLLENEHWPVEPGYVDLQLSCVVRQWVYTQQNLGVSTQKYDEVNVSCGVLRNLALELATACAVDERLNTLDSRCNLARTLALAGQKIWQLTNDTHAVKANQLMRELDAAATQEKNFEFQVKAVRMGLRYVPNTPAWSCAYQHWQDRAETLGLVHTRFGRSGAIYVAKGCKLLAACSVCHFTAHAASSRR